MKSGRRRVLKQLPILGLSPWVAACSPDPGFAVASHVWPGYELMFVARQEGWLPDHGLLLHETVSASESLAALATGQVAGAALTLDEVLLARGQAIPLTVVLIFNISNGADVVLGRAGMRSIADLRGARIGVETSALGALLVHEILARSGIRRSEVEIVPATADQHDELWESGGVAALITYEPMASRLENRGAVRLFDSRAMPDTIFDVLAVRPDLPDRHRDALRALLAAHFRALRHLRHSPFDAAYRMAGRLGLSGPEVLETLRNLELPDLGHNRRYLGVERERIEEAARKLVRIMVDASLLARPDDLAGLVDDRYLPAVVPA